MAKALASLLVCQSASAAQASSSAHPNVAVASEASAATKGDRSPAIVPVADAPIASLSLPFPWRAWRTFSVNDLLPHNLVYAIAQAPDGYVYAGLGLGLVHYDGATWERIDLPGVQGVHAVGAVHIGSDGAVWIGTDAAGVFRIQGGRILAVPGLSGSAAVVYTITEERGGRVWASTEGGLARCSVEGCRLFEPLRGVSVRTVRYGHGPHGPCLWIGTGGKGLLRFDVRADGELIATDFHLGKSDGLPNNYVSNLIEWGGANARDLWIGTGRGLARFDGNRLVRYTPAIGFPGAVTAFESGRGADRGMLFVGLQPGGLAVLREDGAWTLAGQAQGLPDSAVQSLAYTEFGSGMPLLWVGTHAGGIARTDPGRWQLLDERREVPARGMSGLGVLTFPDGARSLWMGSAGATLRLTASGWQPIAEVPRDTIVADMAGTADGSLWIAGQHSLWQVHGSDRREYTVDNSQLPAVYADLLTVERGAEHGDDVLWIGSGHGLARWTRAGGLAKVEDHPLLASGQSIRSLAIASLDHEPPRVWVGLDEGLLERVGDRWRSMAADCLRHASVLALAGRDGPLGGEVWIGTDSGLLRLRAGRCERFDGIFPGGFPQQIAFDRLGRAYVFGTGGVVRLDSRVDAPLSTLPSTRFDREDGLTARDFLAGHQVATDPQGRIWVASTAALQVFDPASEAASPSAARLAWETIAAGTPARTIAPHAELSANATPVVFAARLLSFEREERIEYRVQLGGLQAEAQPWTKEHRFEFSRLGAGAYEARIWARDANGAVSGPVRFPFIVLAPWWLRPWALTLGAAALIALGLLVGWWRTRALRSRARELASEVATRTHELANANRLLEEMSRTDTLTGLHNRRHAVSALPELARRHEERRHAGSLHELLLVLIDVDHFKRINDSLGHAAGDAVLRTVAARLRGGVRDSDLLVRWGGEEFLLALNDCDPGLASARLRKVLASVSDAPVPVGDVALPISISAGAVAYVPPSDSDGRSPALALEQAIAQADAALYEAKNRGRDRAVLVVDGADAVAGNAHWPEIARNG
jgi:diguanylate cyclase (GGDEF)-like protein